MWTLEQKEMAERTALDLARLQGRTGSDVLRKLELIRKEVGNYGVTEHERAAVWLSISGLVQALAETPNSPSISGHWSKAVRDANAWRGSMRN